MVRLLPSFPFPLFAHHHLLTPFSRFTGGFFLALGATLTPSFNAQLPYESATGILNDQFFSTFGFFYLFVGVLSFVFFICSFRTNICLVVLFLAYTLAFPLLAAAEFAHADGDLELAHRLTVGGGAACLVVSICGWWAMIGGLLESVDFPIRLPMGDLSTIVPSGTGRGMHDVQGEVDVESAGVTAGRKLE